MTRRERALEFLKDDEFSFLLKVKKTGAKVKDDAKLAANFVGIRTKDKTPGAHFARKRKIAEFIGYGA